MKLLKVEGQKVPLIVRKSDGGFGYDSTDLAAIRYRFVEQGKDRVIYVVDQGQSLHFDLIFAAAGMAGWTAGGRVAEHCKFGLVCGDDGKRYRTRDGGVVRLVDLLDRGREKALDVLKQRAADGSGRVQDTDEQMMKAAETLAYSGVKYFDLARDRLRDYKFSYDAMLNQQGDTAVYLQYAHARMCSILSKSGKDIEALAKTEKIQLRDPQEVNLALEILTLADVVDEVRRELQLLPLCRWLRQLCVKFSAFTRDCKVIGNEHETSRLLIVHTVVKSMRQVMGLLGFDALERL
jgi:arginyl-tRNA synthetase